MILTRHHMARGAAVLALLGGLVACEQVADEEVVARARNARCRMLSWLVIRSMIWKWPGVSG